MPAPLPHHAAAVLPALRLNKCLTLVPRLGLGTVLAEVLTRPPVQDFAQLRPAVEPPLSRCSEDFTTGKSMNRKRRVIRLGLLPTLAYGARRDG